MAFLRPSFIDNMGWEMARVYGAVTDQILINLAKYFPYWKPGQPVPQSAFEYQVTMLAQMGKVNRETIKIIRQGLKDADEALENVIEQAIMEAVSKSEPGLIDAVKKGILHPVGRPIVAPNQMKAFDLYYEQAAQKLNLVNTVMLESTKQAYQATVSDIANRVQVTQTALDIGAGETITGVSSWNTAMVHAINRMKQNGIVGFIDHGGHRWSAEAYTAMDIRTTVANTARAAVWETNQNFGNDLYMVSYHDGARPLCYPYQNRVISASNQFGVTYDLDGNEIEYIAQSATTYGQPAGLFGINCKHYPTPFIPGVSVITGDPQNFEDNERAYKESQQQRALERKIREEKRDLLMMKAQGAPAEAIKAQRAKIRATDDEIDAFCDETGRARRQNREGAYTSRVFPDPDTYDVGEFERKQKDEIEKYFSGGGSQQGYTFGQMTPDEPITPATPPENVASQSTQTQKQEDTIDSAQLDAKNFPDSFNKKKTSAFVDAVNATEGADPDVVALFNKLGEQVDGAGYPVTISYTEDGHSVGEYVRTYGGDRAKIVVKVPKLADPEYLQQEIGTTAHEWGHLFDYLNSEKGVMSNKFDGGALPNAIQNARPMSERVKKLIADAVSAGNDASRAAMDAAKIDIDAINARISDAISKKNYGEYTRLSKERNKLWKQAEKDASKASRKAHNGVNAIEDIFDAISGGTLRDKTPGLYGHGSKYYSHNPGGENAATETLANYCNLALAYPDLFKLMAEEQPEIWSACGNIVRAMLER